MSERIPADLLVQFCECCDRFDLAAQAHDRAAAEMARARNALESARTEKVRVLDAIERAARGVPADV